MKPGVWRLFTITAVFFALCFALAYRAFEIPRTDFGFTSSAAGTSRIVTAVDPAGPAAKAGIRPGDLIKLAAPTTQARIDFANPHAGDMLEFTRIRGGQSASVALRAPPGNFSDFPIPVTIERVVLLLFAALLAWRRPDDIATRFLVVFLLAFGFALALNNAELPNRYATLLVLQCGSFAAFILGTWALVQFAAIFPSAKPGDLRAGIARAASVVAGIAIAIFVGVEIAAGFADVRAAVPNALVGAGEAFLVVGAIVNLSTGFHQARGIDRQRQLWVLLTFGLGLAGPLIAFASIALGKFNPVIDGIAVLTIPIIPAGLTYVILRHRVLDVGFVINRAVVFAVVSLVIVAALAIADFLIGKYVDEFSHAASVYIQLGAAIGLGFSIRFVHARIDRVVDDIFFRARHEAEAAIRRFAREAPLVTDIAILVNRTVRVVRDNTQAKAAVLYAQKEGGVFSVLAATDDTNADVEENDPAVLSMRTWHQIVDLDGTDTALRGDIALPMVVRGELLGFLLCDAKSGAETYAPDEREALGLLALAVGASLNALSVAALRTEVARLTSNGLWTSQTQERLRRLATGGAQTAFQLMSPKTPEEIRDQS